PVSLYVVLRHALVHLRFYRGLCFFFFQAEDGIRDFHVTGVQTCALPISTRPRAPSTASGSPSGDGGASSRSTPRRRCASSTATRSEERRVGKERSHPRAGEAQLHRVYDLRAGFQGLLFGAACYWVLECCW